METNQTSLLGFWLGSRLRKAFTPTTGFLSRNGGLFQVLTTLFLTSFFSTKAFSQDKKQLVRLAKLVIDSTHLERYKAALKEETEASVRLEPGVMTLFAVSEKDKPTLHNSGDICGYQCLQSAFENSSFHKLQDDYEGYGQVSGTYRGRSSCARDENKVIMDYLPIGRPSN